MNFKALLTLGAMFTALGFTSCSNDDFKVSSTAPKGNPVEVSVMAAIANGNDSRAIFEETAAGAIKSKWNAGDCIFAYDIKNEAFAGYLVAEEPDENGFSMFSGTLYLDSSTDLTFYYLGTDPNRDFNEFWIDLTKQTRSLDELGELAVMYDSDVPFTYNPNGISKLERDLLFNLIISYAHFNITLPEGVEYNGEDIVLRGKNLKTGAALLLMENKLDIEDWTEDEQIIINGIGDLYFAFIPGTNIELNFTTTIDDVDYHYEYPRLMNFEPAVYYRRDAGNGNFVGVPINLVPTQELYTFELGFTVGWEPNNIGRDYMKSVTGRPDQLRETVRANEYTFTIPDNVPECAGYTFLGYNNYFDLNNDALYQPGDEITLNIADELSSSFTVSDDGKTYKKVLQCVWQRDVVLDGTVYGNYWTDASTRSWIDSQRNNKNGVYIFSYIPGIPFDEQGLTLYYTDDSFYLTSNNPYIYHFQWDRNFGFMASNSYIEDTNVPNYANLPSNWNNQYNYYTYSSSQIARNKSLDDYDVFYYPGGADWCSTSRTTWTMDQIDDQFVGAAAQGYHIPSVDDLVLLRPEDENNIEYHYSKSYTVGEYTIYPFFVRQVGDGSSIVWSYLPLSRAFVDIRRVVGNLTLDTLTAENLVTVNPIQLGMDGYRTNGKVLGFGETGFYWSADGDTDTPGYAYCMRWDVNTSNKTVKCAIGAQPRKFAFSVRCVLD